MPQRRYYLPTLRYVGVCTGRLFAASTLATARAPVPCLCILTCLLPTAPPPSCRHHTHVHTAKEGCGLTVSIPRRASQETNRGVLASALTRLCKIQYARQMYTKSLGAKPTSKSTLMTKCDVVVRRPVLLRAIDTIENAHRHSARTVCLKQHAHAQSRRHDHVLLSHRALTLRRRLLQSSSTEFSSLTSLPFDKFSLALAKAYLLGFRRVLNTKFDRCRALFHHETLDSWHKYLLPEIGSTPRPIQRVCKCS